MKTTFRRSTFTCGKKPLPARGGASGCGVLFPTVLALALLAGCSGLNRYQADGQLPLAGLQAPVRVTRDGSGMAYIHARTLADAIRAQGFVTAQDRLFQMELARRMAAGRLAEFAGEPARQLDIRMRAIGCLRHARAHAAILSPASRDFFQWYVDGINACIATRGEELPLEFKLAGIRPEPWQVADSLSIAYLLGWQTSANLAHEITAQVLLERLGAERAAEIMPLNVNPDDPRPAQAFGPGPAHARLGLAGGGKATGGETGGAPAALSLGSHNWAVAPRRSPAGTPIVANDPHLDARLLPGPFYPSGLFTPELRIVGAGIAGIPGMVTFRTDHVAAGVSNSYGDSQDLYVETVDPGRPTHYLEGGEAHPFGNLEERIRVRDDEAPGGMREETVAIRLTRRGPVVSGLIPGLATDRVVTLRWAAAESMGPSLGLERLVRARSAEEVRRALSDLSFVMLNFIFADTGGNIGWQATGRLPIRTAGDGTVPFPAGGGDNWAGWIPFEEMPGESNPRKGWLGACNHRTVTAGFPYYYSSYCAPANRYRRLGELVEGSSATTAEDHWQWQRDTLNATARAVVPKMLAALSADEGARPLAQILAQWDFHDDADQVAPTLFHAIYLAFARQVFADELGEKALERLLADPYFWEERLERIALTGDSVWVDDVATAAVETAADLFRRAATDARQSLGESLGPDPARWTWGRVHRIEFLNPIRRQGLGKGWLGGGDHPAPGSGATLNRGRYDYNAPYAVTVSAALRVVYDLSDPDRIPAVLAGGVCGRTFSPHQKDQIGPYLSGEKRYWWFSDRSVAENAVSRQTLTPDP